MSEVSFEIIGIVPGARHTVCFQMFVLFQAKWRLLLHLKGLKRDQVD